MNINSFDFLEENEDLYINLGKNLSKRLPEAPENREKFIKNLSDHYVDLEEVNKKITIETTRTNYTHRKNIKTNLELVQKIKNKKRDKKAKKINKESVDAEMIEEGKDKLINENENLPERQINKKNLKRKETQKDQIVLMLVFNRSPHNNFGNSLSMFIESGYSLGMLRRFSYAGSKVIGLKEYNLIKLEKEEIVYPNDFPHTVAYQELQEVKVRKDILAY